ncbi:WD40/YVTN/BNR-like repeat-containing protein [Congregibacter sp.]|uniref:WD40/YVTN/BNR-like repeat-containing protein n=1 Tax=Congregibacter sp. TaxID=2744308 RepID=UPI00385B4FE1
MTYLRISRRRAFVMLLTTLGFCLAGLGGPALSADSVDASLYQTMAYRNIGPFRGGRVTAVAGIKDDPLTYYFGATGGGVWKTTSAGSAWENVSDGFFNTGGIGAIDIADSDPNIIFVGTGEGPVRGVKTSHGDGVYKSTDGGKTWTHMGLEATRHISRIHIHPRNPDVVFLAAQGNPWGANEERGIYKTVDGGKNWTKVLFVNEDSGFADMSMDASDPNFLMATSWDFRRRPWVVKSGGPGSRVYKTTDGGESWTEVTKGLPELKGKMGIAISPANQKIVYAAVEAKDGQGGVYRSDDSGESFTQVSDDPNTWARAWYYMHITADPNDEDEVWVMNGVLIKSIDGGKNFERIKAPHVDHHAVWINPSDSNILINGNDGGANVSMDGGATWSTQMNQPTGQFYRVITDNNYPYRIYSAQQDSNGITIASQSMSASGGGIGLSHWWSIGSGESATIAFNKDDPKYVYTTFFASMLGEWNRDTRQYRNVRPYPERITGEEPKNLRYRANWNGPVIVSPHDPERLYYGSQYLMTSTDRGVSWTVISDDLTRNDKDHQGRGGYPISNEQITAESYNNLFVIAESPVRQGIIWTGSDDGLVHLTQDGGKTWKNVTPRGLSEGIINVIDASPHDAGTAYFARAGFKMNDFTPVIYKTDDYGKSWKKIVKGIPSDTFARTVRVDPKRPGLLYAGTENGLFVSFDDGGNWQSLQLNLPQVPITDLYVQQDDLVVSTQGRSLWILDDLTPLHQLFDGIPDTGAVLLDPRDPIRNISNGYPDDGPGENPPRGLQVHYVLSEQADEPIQFEIVNQRGDVIHTDRSDLEGTICGRGQAEIPRPETISTKIGDNLWEWRLQMGEFECLPEIYSVSGSMDAYTAAPGDYTVRMTIGGNVQEQSFKIRVDPRLGGDTAENLQEYAEMDALSSSLMEAATAMSKGVTDLRLIKKQLALINELGPPQEVVDKGTELESDVDAWIELILQKELKTFQHVYQHEGRFLMKIKDLLGRMHRSQIPLTDGFKEVTGDYLQLWSGYEAQLATIRGEGLDDFNALAEKNRVSTIKLP